MDKFLIIFLSLLPLALISGPLFSDIIISLGSFIFLITLLFKNEFKYFKNIFSFIFFPWCVYLIILSLFAENIFLSLESSLFYFRFGVFSILIFYLLDNYNYFKKYFFVSLLFCFLLLIFDGFIQYFFGKNILGIPYTANRVSSFFGEEKILGSYLSRLFPLLIGLIIYLKINKSLKITLIFFTLIFCDILIYLSGERTAFFNLILSSFLFIILLNKYTLIRIFSLVLSIIIITLISLSFPDIKHRMVDKTFSQLNLKKIETSDNQKNKIHIFSIQHQVLYISAYRIFKDNIFFGIGPKMFRETCAKEKYVVKTKLDMSVNGCQTSPHNYYIQLLSETGLFGAAPMFIFFFYICFIFFKHLYYKLFLHKNLLTDFQVSLFVCIFITLFPFVPSGNFFNNYISIIHFLPIGFLIYTFNKI